jgi:hypothetical protein
VFKDRPVNHDPREVYVRELFTSAASTTSFTTTITRCAGAVRSTRRLAQRLLRQHRRGDRGVAAQDPVAAVSKRCLRGAGARDGRLHGVPVPANAGLRSGDRRPHNRGRNMDTRTPASQCRS